MNKRFYRAVCLVLSGIMLLAAAGCNDTKNVWSEWIETVAVNDGSSSESEIASPEDTSAADSKSSQRTDTKKNIINITSKGRSEYKIVVSLSNDGYDEGRLVQKVIKATSKASVPLILDTESSNGPEIIIGDTTRAESKSLMSTVGNNEYAVKSDADGNIIIAAANSYALKLGVENFLTTYFGYDKNATEMGTGKEKSIPVNLNIRKNMLDEYKLVWSDEFNGSTLDTDKWNFLPLMREQTHLKLRDDESVFQLGNGSIKLFAGRIDDENYIPSEKVKRLTEEHLADIVNGQRDFRF